MRQEQFATSVGGGPFYRALWRWHFYAGLLVIPFLLILSVSGMLMLLSKPLDALLHKDLLNIQSVEQALPASSQLVAVQEQFPDGQVQLYIPPREATDSAQFSVVPNQAGDHAGHGAASTTVYLNPANGEILGTLDPATSLYARIQAFHGTLYLGNLGDSLIEIAAGLAVLMVLSGIYLAWPRDGWRALIPIALISRSDWRRVHGLVGLLIAIPLLFFLLSGLSWTNIWGGKMLQAWSSLPGTSFVATPAAETHESMNNEGMHQVPWTLEQTPMPESGATTDMPTEIGIDQVTAIAAEQGFTQYRVHFPAGDQGVWTISATTIAGDLTDPTRERTLHLDRSTGTVLADLRFADYPAMGKAMAAGIPLHQGDLGLWNLLLNLLFCTLVILMIVSGIRMWWKRRPEKTHTLAPPPAAPEMSRTVLGLMLVCALCFPLSAATIAVVVLLDWLLLGRFKQLQVIFK